MCSELQIHRSSSVPSYLPWFVPLHTLVARPPVKPFSYYVLSKLICFYKQSFSSNCFKWCIHVASSPGHSQILSCSCGEKLGEGLGSLLRHGPEIVDSVSMNQVHHFWSLTMITGLLPIFLHGCKIKSENGLGTRLVYMCEVKANRKKENDREATMPCHCDTRWKLQHH